MLSVAATLLLLLLSVEAQDSSTTEYRSNTSLPTTYPPKIVEGGEQVCPDTQTVRDEITSEVRELLHEAFPCPGQSQQSPISSCSVLSTDCPSGYYWASLPNGTVTQVYCSTDTDCSSSNTTIGGWTRIAYLNMTDPNQQCPPNFRQVESPVRTCGRVTGPGCASTTFPVHGVEYNRVCGKITAYQYGNTDAFYNYHVHRQITIDGVYVDGVSLTHGRSPRKHIWTFAAELSLQRTSLGVCPCNRPDLTYTAAIPPFIGQDYFCETGSNSQYVSGYYPYDPLWDGMGCGPLSACCSFNNPPWFHKELSYPTTDDIELRLCSEESINAEDAPIELVELYVQ